MHRSELGRWPFSWPSAIGLLAIFLTTAGALFIVFNATASQADETDWATPRSAAELKRLEGRVQKAIEKVRPAVIAVGGGSGVVISAEGYVLTVAHVDREAGRRVQVTFPDGRRAQAVTLGNDFGLDAAMLKIQDPGPWPHADTLSSRDLKPGQWCVSLGYAVTFNRGSPPPARIGRVLRNDHDELITDCTIMGGDSGCPLVDLDGHVIGIGSKCDMTLTYNFYVPTARFGDVWSRLLKSEDFDSLHPKHALLGVLADDDGTNHVESVRHDGPADKAGIRAGDIITKVDGHDAHDFETILNIIQARAPGDTIDVVFTRDGKEQTVSVKLGEAPLRAKR